MMAINQRMFLYIPIPGPTEPSTAGLPDFTHETLVAPDGNTVIYWESTSAQNQPIILYFHGNSGGLYAFVPALKFLHAQGFHVAAMEYRSFAGAAGHPTQPRLVADAQALYDQFHARYPHQPIIFWGYSLGSGVAVQLAALRTPAAMVLEAPFTAVVDVAALRFPFLPVHWLLHDQYRSAELIRSIHVPLLILHGEQDRIVPIAEGRALYDAANQPKILRTYPNFGHLDFGDSMADADAVTFLRRVARHP